MNTFDDILVQEIANDEGFRTKSYMDSKGYWTIGIGHLLGNNPIYANTVWTEIEVMTIFLQDLNVSIYHCGDQISVFNNLSLNRQRVLVNMMFNLGPYKFAKFTNTKHAIEIGDTMGVYNGMLNSKWAQIDIPKRAKRLADRWLAG